MPTKRKSSADLHSSASKQQKTEHVKECSRTVKKRLQSSNRTGQACDRCKVRKIRCDGLSGACSNCLQNGNECMVTDRSTGEAYRRGYVQELEEEREILRQQVQDLEERLVQHGIEPQTYNKYDATSTSDHDDSPSTTSTNLEATPNQLRQNSIEAKDPPKDLPAFRASCRGDNYLGVSPGGSLSLSSIRGTALSILGMDIDIADFQSQDMDEPDPSASQPRLYNKSYQAFLQSSLGVNHRIDNLELPKREIGMTYIEWYFGAIAPYIPFLHKPTVVKLAARMYDDLSFVPTAAETVIVHMIMAVICFQFGTRNSETPGESEKKNSQSNLHYHFCLSKFYDLVSSHTFQDVQALTLICAHLRNFPKPGASWIMTQTTMALAIELGLHRSAKRWASCSMPSALEIEMRKRTFWSLLAIDITLSGKLGRPMTFRTEDFDVELPEPIDDELLSENGLDESRPGKCGHLVGLAAYRILPLFNELYNTIYAVRRRPDLYESQVLRLEALLKKWQEELPEELVNGDAGVGISDGQVFALYTQVWALEFRLLLRHPSVSQTKDQEFEAANLRICVETARKMLIVVKALGEHKSLDTTWYNSTVYVMAITTTLFNQFQKRGESSAADLASVKGEMNMWLDIMGDVGKLLGSGTRLRDAVRVVIEGTLALLDKRVLPTRLPTLPASSQYMDSDNIKNEPDSEGSMSPSVDPSPAFNNFSFGSDSQGTNFMGQSQLANQPAPYPSQPQYNAYPNSSQPPINQYIDYQTTDSSGQAENQMMHAFSQAPQPQYAYQTDNSPASMPAAWQHYTSTMAGTFNSVPEIPPQPQLQMQPRPQLPTQRQNSIAAISPTNHGHAMVHNHMGDMGDMGMQHMGQGPPMNHSWPLNLFDMPPGGGH
ncbi:hypothetical protein BP5796_06944 [Coleophoma crateriformis]|uniref:Zn(2)-C6 fungal-type domain-containing protein n=1 Tax=Coleophoma crateriformis TaxID=565419 RepID=A0A3D8RPY6_9HELO|nr:hypothetical protein BP5796_06944 [Coleophoma crateriformis]